MRTTYGACGALGLALCLVLLGAGCGGHDADHGALVSTGAADAPPSSSVAEFVFEESPPLFREEGIYPCSECHDEEWETNTERRELSMMHEDIVLVHDSDNRWCLDCHDIENRDMLRLANGTLVPFTESYRLCGQCHGDKFRDWRAGDHGRRIGFWDGEKKHLLCVSCHHAHAPQFKLIPPEPEPRRPEAIKRAQDRAEETR